jgi:hypothetical protein
MKTNLLKLACALALLGAAAAAPAQSVLSDVFANNGFTDPITSPYIGSMTLTYDGAALAPNTTYMLTDIPNFQFDISLTGSDNNTYTFNNSSLAAGSDLSAIEIIVLSSGGFLFSNTADTPDNNHGGSADFLNVDGSFLTTAPPGFLSGDPAALAGGYSFYVLGNNETSVAMGDYGAGIAPVPEPSTLALSAVAGLGLLLFRRRKYHY